MAVVIAKLTKNDGVLNYLEAPLRIEYLLLAVFFIGVFQVCGGFSFWFSAGTPHH